MRLGHGLTRPGQRDDSLPARQAVCARFGQYAPMPEPSWVFEVEDSFAVGGYGTAVLGRLRGTIPSSRTVALLHVGEAVPRSSEVWVEFARVRGDDRICSAPSPGALGRGTGRVGDHSARRAGTSVARSHGGDREG